RRVHGVFGVDEGADPTPPLRLRHDVVDERRLPRRLWAEDLDDASAREPSYAERHVERERAGRAVANRELRPVAHAHARSLAELSLDLAECDMERFLGFHLILPASSLPTERSRVRAFGRAKDAESRPLRGRVVVFVSTAYWA